MGLRPLQQTSTASSNIDNDFMYKSNELSFSFGDSLLNDIDKYYKLKQNYLSVIQNHKSKILNNKLLSRKEKKTLWNEYTPTCIACRGQGGCAFNSIYNKDIGRVLLAHCNSDPKCDFNIEIRLSESLLLNKLIQIVDDDMNSYKKDIIVNKNDLIFGITTDDDQLFNDIIEKITSLIEEKNGYFHDFIQHNEKFNDVFQNSVDEIYRIIKSCDDDIVGQNNILKLIRILYDSTDDHNNIINYYNCKFFSNKINESINIMKLDQDYNSISLDSDPGLFKLKNILNELKLYFNRIFKIKYDVLNIKHNVENNEYNFIHRNMYLTECIIGDSKNFGTVKFTER